MKPGLFLDTSGWFAALSERDQHHVRAEPFYQATLGAAKFALVTTNLVVAEVHALLARERGPTVAVRYLDHLNEDPSHEVVWATRDLQRRAVDRWLRPFSTHGFSLADAVGFELMRERGVTTAFTFDRHFTVAGFEVVP